LSTCLALAQQLLDPGLRVGIAALAEVPVNDATVLVDQILRRPVLVAESVPGLVVVVLRDRIADAESLHCALEVAKDPLMAVLGRVHADYYQALCRVALMELLHVGQYMDAVDAVVGPELDQHDFSAQLLQRERGAVDPVVDSREFRSHGRGSAAGRLDGIVEGARRARGGTQAGGEEGDDELEHVQSPVEKEGSHCVAQAVMAMTPKVMRKRLARRLKNERRADTQLPP